MPYCRFQRLCWDTGRLKWKKPMRRHHTQWTELPVFYNIHSDSNFIHLATLSWWKWFRPESRKQWRKYLSYEMSSCFPICNHIKRDFWNYNQDLGWSTDFILFFFAWECKVKGMLRVTMWLSLTIMQTLFSSCRMYSCFFFSICTLNKPQFKLCSCWKLVLFIYLFVVLF